MKNKILFLIGLFYASFANAQTLQDAKKLTEYEQYEGASSMYSNLLKTNPNDFVTYYYYGDNLLKADNPDSAKILFEKGQSIDPANPFIKIGKAKFLLDEINLREAKSASDKDPSNQELKTRYTKADANVNAAYALIDDATSGAGAKNTQVLIEAAEALIHFSNKNTTKAKALLDKINQKDQESNIDVKLLYGDIYAELNNGTLAADYYNQALELNKSSARAIVNKGILYKRTTNYEGAAQEYENAIKVEPGFAPAYRELAETYVKLGKFSKAKDAYKQYLDISKNNRIARIGYAKLLYLSKDYPGALIELDQVRKSGDSNNVTMLRILSYCYFETKDYEKGLNTVNKLFSIVPPEKRSSMDMEYSGKLLVKNNQDSLGIEHLKIAFSLDPNRTDLLSEMGDTYLKLKQYDKAIAMFTQKIATGKDVKSTDHYSLARSYYFNALSLTGNFMEQLQLADSSAAKAIVISPQWASAWLWRAKINAQIDSTSDSGLAKPYYEKYIELALADSANPQKYQKGLIEAYKYLAYYYVLKRDNEHSIEYLNKEKELPLDPEDVKILNKAIEQLKNVIPKGKEQKK